MAGFCNIKLSLEKRKVQGLNQIINLHITINISVLKELTKLLPYVTFMSNIYSELQQDLPKQCRTPRKCALPQKISVASFHGVIFSAFKLGEDSPKNP